MGWSCVLCPAGCDDIIRQHKAACLRITSMVAAKDTLWVGTSAGVVVTTKLPYLGGANADGTPHLAGGLSDGCCAN